jgi:hypothetical protein
MMTTFSIGVRKVVGRSAAGKHSADSPSQRTFAFRSRSIAFDSGETGFDRREIGTHSAEITADIRGIAINNPEVAIYIPEIGAETKEIPVNIGETRNYRRRTAIKAGEMTGIAGFSAISA